MLFSDKITIVWLGPITLSVVSVFVSNNCSNLSFASKKLSVSLDFRADERVIAECGLSSGYSETFSKTEECSTSKTLAKLPKKTRFRKKRVGFWVNNVSFNLAKVTGSHYRLTNTTRIPSKRSQSIRKQIKLLCKGYGPRTSFSPWTTNLMKLSRDVYFVENCRHFSLLNDMHVLYYWQRLASRSVDALRHLCVLQTNMAPVCDSYRLSRADRHL